MKYYVKKEIRNLLHANIDVHSRRLIAEFPVYIVKCISKLQSNCSNMNFAEKVRYDGIFQQIIQKKREICNDFYQDNPKHKGFISFIGKQLL